jgi:hypothetical protein
MEVRETKKALFITSARKGERSDDAPVLVDVDAAFPDGVVPVHELKQELVAIGEPDVLRTVYALVDAVESEYEQADRLIDALSPERVLGPAAHEQMRLNAEARQRFLQQWPCLTSGEVAELLGSTASNRAATAHKLLSKQAIFAVSYKGRKHLYPAFQFDELQGKLRAGVGEALQRLRAAGLKGWELAFWFTEPNGWLEDDARPVDLLASDPDAVVAAAGHEAEIPE